MKPNEGGKIENLEIIRRAISPGLNGKRVTKRSSRHTQNSVASLRAEIRDTGKKTCTRTADYGTTPSS